MKWQALTNANGDLTRSLYELETPSRRQRKSSLRSATLCKACSTAWRRSWHWARRRCSIKLQAAVNTRTGIAALAQALPVSIEGLQIQGFQNRGDLSGGIAFPATSSGLHSLNWRRHQIPLAWLARSRTDNAAVINSKRS